jgi:hypothetical protein
MVMIRSKNENDSNIDSLSKHFCSWDEIGRRWKEALDKGCRFGYMYMDSFEPETYYDFSSVPPNEDVFDYIASFCNWCIHIPEVFILDHDLEEQKLWKYYCDTSGDSPKTLRGIDIPWHDVATLPHNPAVLLPDRENIYVAGKVAIDTKCKYILAIRNDWLYQDWYTVLIPPKFSIYETIPAIHGVLENHVMGVYNPNLFIDLQIDKLRFVGRDPIPDTLAYTPDDLHMRLRGILGLYLVYITSDPMSLEAKFFWTKAWDIICSLGPQDTLWALPQLQKLILVASVMGVNMPEEAQAFAGIEDWQGTLETRFVPDPECIYLGSQ